VEAFKGVAGEDQMKPLQLLMCLLIASLLNIASLPSSCAQSWDEEEAERSANSEILADQQEAQREMDTKIYGRVTEIDPDRNIILLVPTKWVDDGTIMGSSDRYFVESDATFTGRSSLEDISVGDYITIDYYVFGDLNRATGIIFEKRGKN
jgi:hypothetical protein